MEFKSFIVFDEEYGSLEISQWDDWPPTSVEEITGIEYNFESKKLDDIKGNTFWVQLGNMSRGTDPEQWKWIYELFKCIGVANEVYPEYVEKDEVWLIKYHGTSTDELTLVDFLYW